MFFSNPRERYTIDTSKTTQFSDAWVLLAIILLIVGLIFRNFFLTTAAALLLSIAAIGWLWNYWSLSNLQYTRTLNEVRAFPGEELTLTLTVNNHKILPLTWLIVRDLFPTGIPIDGKELIVNPSTNLIDFTTFWMPGARQKISRTFRLSCVQRGYYRFGPATLETGDAFGFFEKRGTQRRFVEGHLADEESFLGAAMRASDHLIIYPRIYSVVELQLPARNPFGAATSRMPLYEDPLRTAGVREWQEFDSMRRIHWLASARQQTLLSRIYEPSEEQQVLVFLNVATLERHWQGVIADLLERCISVAGSIAALTLEERLPTGILCNGAVPNSDQEIRLLPGRSPNQLMHILELLAGVTPFATLPIEELIQREATRLPWGTTLVVVSAMAHDELLITLEEIAQGGRRVTLVTLAAEPPRQFLRRVELWHLPHLVDDLIAPMRVDETSLLAAEMEPATKDAGTGARARERAREATR